MGDEAALTIDSTTGIVKLNGSPDFESKSQYQFTVIATDNGLPTQKTEKSVVVYVNDANDAPTSKGDAGTQTVVNGKAFSFNLANSFADVDAGTNGTLRFAISNGTLPAGLSLDPATGLITGSATTDGLVAFTVTATDTNGATNSLSVAQNFAFNVVSAPAVLSFTAVDSTGITTAGRAGEGMVFTIVVSEAVTVTGTPRSPSTWVGQLLLPPTSQALAVRPWCSIRLRHQQTRMSSPYKPLT